MVKSECVSYFESRLKEQLKETDKRLDGVEEKCLSAVTESQAAFSTLKQEFDKLDDKMRESQTETFVINKNIAANQKRLKFDISEVKERSLISMNIIESLLEQAIAAEQIIQMHLDQCSKERANMTLRTAKVNMSQDSSQ